MGALSGIGIAGIGRMGLPMLQALRDAGFDARGHDIRPPASYGADGAHITDDVAAFREGLKTLLVVVRDAAQTEALLFGEQNLGQAPELETLIVCSTLSPRYVKGLAPRLPHLRMIDAPMSGAQIGAIERRLSFMLGGDAADLDRMQPLFEAMGKNIFRLGPFGSGISTKVLNNLVCGASTAMTRLALDWGEEAGLDQRALLDVMEASTGQTWFSRGYDGIEFAKDGYSEDNTIGILAKDIEAALDAAPEGSDTGLPEAVRLALRGLKDVHG